ncbi:MAG: hypothetical protein QOF89_4285 [Acidobacteriota bacterium]|jgi:hypothetical protein|nr:hypothetical protein [Acidobacteriota bacterium]
MRRFLLTLALVLAAAPAAARQEPGLVRLSAPRAGEVLTGGATAELAWAPQGPFERLDHVEEWEAFLSFDGGATYPVRITPHLDRDLRQVRWQVPAIPTRDARLLLRFGDERRETYVEIPQRFAIAEAPTPWAPPPLFGGAAPATSRGEPALPGHPGVVAWVEGSRQGGSLRPVVATGPPALRETFRTPTSHSEAAVLGSENRPDGPPAPAATGAGTASPLRGRSLAAAGERSLLPSPDILLLTQRQNE